MKSKLFLFVAVLSLSTFVQAQEETLFGYEDIVKELSGAAPNRSRSRWSDSDGSPLDNVLLHGGVGLTNMFGSLDVSSNRRVYLNQKGIQASLGIDLLSSQWFAEGSIRSFGPTSYGETTVQLKEFDLKVLYRPSLLNSLKLKIGGGVSGRYLRVTDSSYGTADYKTPSSVGVMGLDLFLSRSISLGTEVSVRTALIDETIDRQSFDGVFRLDTHF